jgi:hypothetical protein
MYSRSFAERNNKGNEELDDEGWINNLASFVDMTGHLTKSYKANAGSLQIRLAASSVSDLSTDSRKIN